MNYSFFYENGVKKFIIYHERVSKTLHYFSFCRNICSKENEIFSKLTGTKVLNTFIQTNIKDYGN